MKTQRPTCVRFESIIAVAKFLENSIVFVSTPKVLKLTSDNLKRNRATFSISKATFRRNERKSNIQLPVIPNLRSTAQGYVFVIIQEC